MNFSKHPISKKSQEDYEALFDARSAKIASLKKGFL